MKKLIKRVLTIALMVALTVGYLPMETQMVKADDPVINAEVYFVSVATGKLITLNGVQNDPIDITTVYNGEDSVPDNGKFTIYYGAGTNYFADKTIMNFTCKGTNTSWKADNDKVFQMGRRTNPSGWESVRMESQGDGTVAFRSNANGKYFTLDGDVFSLVEIKVDEGEKVSNNEKFIPYTVTKPNAVTDLTVGEVSGTSIEVSWKEVDKCIYSGYEVLYSTSEDGEYKSAGVTGDTNFEVKGLSLSTKYYVKVRTITRVEENDAYKDCAPVSATTLDDYKPEKVEDITLEKTDDGMKLNWEASNGSTMYDVYRSVSRFGDYELLDTVTETSYLDTNPNESQYKNYYKIRGKNSADIGPFSDPASIEINMFGKNMYVFNDTDKAADINKITADIFAKQHYNQFGEDRYTLAFKPGNYVRTDAEVDTFNIGYYTQILGLGKVPTDTKLRNVKVPAALSGNNATCNFWVGFENASIVDTDNNDDPYYNFQWSASQAAPARRLNIERRSTFDWYYGWASGGFIADSVFHKPCGSFSQQQYYYRNCQMYGEAYGVNWNQMLQGCSGDPINTAGYADLKNISGKTNWDKRGHNTIVNRTPVDREKPFLYFDEESDSYKVFVPALRKNSNGVSWTEEDMGQGTSLSVDKCFYIANPDKDDAKTLNAQLKKGMNIIFQPGIYHVDEPLKVTKNDQILLGLGLATIVPDNSDTAIKVSDVGGVCLAGLLIDAGYHSDSLVQIGEEGCNKDHSENPTVLHDIIYRVGGAKHRGTVDTCLVINSNNTIIDHTWIWRADHGDNTGWWTNKSKNGAIINGDNVTAYGLFCEHFQEYDIIWRGNAGSTFFLQNEKCYDPQSQDGWMSHDGEKKGFAAYKVTDNVDSHYAVALGIYDVFINTNGASIHLDNAIEVPNKPDVMIENAVIVEIANGSGPQVGINHVINNTTAGIRTGAGAGGGYALQQLLSYCNEESISLPDYYSQQGNVNPVYEQGETPTVDEYAEKDIAKERMSKDDEIPVWEMTDQDYLDRMEKDDPVPPTPPVNPDKKPVNPVKNTLKVGQSFTSGKYVYKVKAVSGKAGSVALTKVVKKYQKKLKKATIKSSVSYRGYKLKIVEIGKKAFKKCKKLKNLTIGAKVKTIKAKAFIDSKKLKKVKIKGKALKKVAKNAFAKKVRKKIKVKGKKKPKKVLLKSLKRKK
ncbi:MAG: fibronectin type III domain-containing protein [Eubacterium sp.]|nr:fibronectin type III domain-containing protein [Eubacterium sp.]